MEVMGMRQLSICLLAVSLFCFGVTSAVAVPTTHLPLAPSAFSPVVKAKKTDAKTDEKKTLKQQAVKVAKNKTQKKVTHNAEKAALRSLNK
jgi:hypothetical protein